MFSSITSLSIDTATGGTFAVNLSNAVFPIIDITTAGELHELGVRHEAWSSNSTLVARFWSRLQKDNIHSRVQNFVRALMTDAEVSNPLMAMYSFILARYSLHPTVCGAAIRYQWILNGLPPIPELNETLFNIAKEAGGLMTIDEHLFLLSLPPRVEIWRGIGFTNRDEDGESWTLSPKIAKQYASFPGRSPGYIVQGVISRFRIHAYISENREHEVVVDPRAVEIVDRFSIQLDRLKTS